MKDKERNTCPGCSKHCPLDKPKCKFGRAYSEKIKNAQFKPAKRPKGARCASPDSPVGQLLRTGRKLKKGLKKGKITEERLVEALAPGEREALTAILGKLDAARKKTV